MKINHKNNWTVVVKLQTAGEWECWLHMPKNKIFDACLKRFGKEFVKIVSITTAN